MTDVVLDDGTAVELDPIARADIAALIRFHDDLSFETVYRRFFGVHPHLGQVEATHFCVLDDPARFALVARVGPDIVGVARMEPLEPDTTAEVAFVVADEYQHRGLGRILARRLVDAALARGVTRFEADVLADNRPMLRLFPDVGLPVTVTRHHGVARLVCQIPATAHPPLT